MRQKFIIKDIVSESKLNLKEYVNLEREYKNKLSKSNEEIFSLLCEETYDKKQILSAVKMGKKNLVSVLRTDNMYPIIIYAEKIAEAIIKLHDAGSNLSVELFFDDKEFLNGAGRN